MIVDFLNFFKTFKQNIWMFVGIIYTMLAIPYGTYNQLLTLSLLTVLLVYILFMATMNKSGYSIVIVALCLTIPKMIRKTDVYIIGNKWLPVFLGLSIAVVTFMYIAKKKKYPFNGVFLACIAYTLIALLYCTNFTGKYIRGIFYIIIFIHCMFYICYHDKIKLEVMFQGFSLVFIFTSFYALMHYFLNTGPYIALIDRSYAESLGYVFIRRAQGLQCSSLVLSAICMLFHSLILARFLKTRKMAVAMELLCIFVSILTVSRTVLAVMAVQFVLLLYFNRKLRIRTVVIFASVIGLFYYYVLSDTVAMQDLYNRMENRSVHRESGYSTTWEIFSLHPFGVGKQRVARYMHEYNTGGIEEELVTLDNFYLTQIASYGILSFVSFYFYMFYFFKIPRQLKIRENRQALLLIIITWCLLGLSFDVESFEPVTVSCFAMLGILFRKFQLEERKHHELSFDNHH